MYELIRELDGCLEFGELEAQLQRYQEANEKAAKEHCDSLQEIFGEEQYQKFFYTVRGTTSYPYDPLAPWNASACLYVSLEKFAANDGDGNVYFVAKQIFNTDVVTLRDDDDDVYFVVQPNFGNDIVTLKLVGPKTPGAIRLEKGRVAYMTLAGTSISSGPDSELSYITRRARLLNVDGQASIRCVTNYK